MSDHNPETVYSTAEREVMLAGMRRASTAFYGLATAIGNHPFVEFAGLMNEYIKLCDDAHERGIDFTQCNAHTGVKLPMPSHAVDYINEKLSCIFSGRAAVFQRPDAVKEWLMGDALCPCCEGVSGCSPACTFEDDLPHEAERMKEVRALLFGNGA